MLNLLPLSIGFYQTVAEVLLAILSRWGCLQKHSCHISRVLTRFSGVILKILVATNQDWKPHFPLYDLTAKRRILSKKWLLASMIQNGYVRRFPLFRLFAVRSYISKYCTKWILGLPFWHYFALSGQRPSARYNSPQTIAGQNVLVTAASLKGWETRSRVSRRPLSTLKEKRAQVLGTGGHESGNPRSDESSLHFPFNPLKSWTGVGQNRKKLKKRGRLLI